MFHIIDIYTGVSLLLYKFKLTLIERFYIMTKV